MQEFVDYSLNSGLIYPLFHRHISYMLENSIKRKAGESRYRSSMYDTDVLLDRTLLNSLASHASVLNYLEEDGWLTWR